MLRKDSIPIVIISVLMVILVSGCVVFGSAANFKGPEVIPSGFQLVKNTTNENASLLVYQIPGKLPFFIVGAVKDGDKKALDNLTSSINTAKLSNNVTNVIKQNESITINGHQTELYTETMNFFGIGLSFYDTTWHCDYTGLTLVSAGLVRSDQMNEIRNMLVSIKCHRLPFF